MQCTPPPPGPASMRKLKKLTEQWKKEGKPQRLTIDEWWLRKNPVKAPESDVTVVPPYLRWMVDEKGDGSTTGDYQPQWSMWQYTVESAETVNEVDCWRVGLKLTGWYFPRGNKTKRSLGPCKFRYSLHFRKSDLTLLQVAKLGHGDGHTMESEIIDVPAPVASFLLSESFSRGWYLPVMAPATGMADFDPKSLLKPGGSQRRLPFGVAAQKVERLPDGRTTICIARRAATLDNMADTSDTYELQIWRDGLPWWDEAYRNVSGGVRAKLFSIGGKNRAKEPEGAEIIDFTKPPPRSGSDRPSGPAGAPGG